MSSKASIPSTPKMLSAVALFLQSPLLVAWVFPATRTCCGH